VLQKPFPVPDDDGKPNFFRPLAVQRFEGNNPTNLLATYTPDVIIAISPIHLPPSKKTLGSLGREVGSLGGKQHWPPGKKVFLPRHLSGGNFAKSPKRGYRGRRANLAKQSSYMYGR